MANERSFTPGPWRVVEGANNDPEWPDLRIMGGGDELFFAEAAGREDAEMAAAAPDMYNALEAVVSVFTSRGDPGPDAQVEQAALDLAAVALAKARRKADE